MKNACLKERNILTLRVKGMTRLPVNETEIKKRHNCGFVFYSNPRFVRVSVQRLLGIGVPDRGPGSGSP